MTEPVSHNIARVAMIVERDNGQVQTTVLDGRVVDLEMVSAVWREDSLIDAARLPSWPVKWDEDSRAVSWEVRARRRTMPRQIPGLPAYDGEPGRLATFALWPVVGSVVRLPPRLAGDPLAARSVVVESIGEDGRAVLDAGPYGQVSCLVRELRRPEMAATEPEALPSGGTKRTEWMVRWRETNYDATLHGVGGSSVVSVPSFTYETAACGSRTEALAESGDFSDIADVTAVGYGTRNNVLERLVLHRTVIEWADGGRYEGPWVEDPGEESVA